MVQSLRRALAWVSTFALGTLFSLNLGATLVFDDEFNVAASHPDLGRWTTEIGPTSFLGRTQLRDWVTPGPGGTFPISGGAADLALDTFNPSGVSLFGTHAKTLQSFQASGATGYELSVGLQLTTLQPGLVFGIYFYGCDAGPCATNHDELDIELVTNFLQPGPTQRVQLNRYANEPLGAGHGPIVDLPSGFDPLAAHEWSIRWMPGQVTYLLDGTALFSSGGVVPQGHMTANIIAWGPAPEWPDAFDASLQPVLFAGSNQHFAAQVDYVRVSDVPEPAGWATGLAGLAAIALALRRKRAATP